MEKHNIGEFCWNELVTSDANSAKDFYGTLFGWEFYDSTIGDITYTFIKSANKEFAGIWQIPKDKIQEIQPHWMGYILVNNLEEKIQKAQSLGATIKIPSTTITGYGRFALIKDPNGAHIAIWESIKK